MSCSDKVWTPPHTHTHMHCKTAICDDCDWVDPATSVNRPRPFHMLQGTQNHQSWSTTLLAPHLPTFCANGKWNKNTSYITHKQKHLIHKHKQKHFIHNNILYSLVTDEHLRGWNVLYTLTEIVAMCNITIVLYNRVHVPFTFPTNKIMYTSVYTSMATDSILVGNITWCMADMPPVSFP